MCSFKFALISYMLAIKAGLVWCWTVVGLWLWISLTQFTWLMGRILFLVLGLLMQLLTPTVLFVVLPCLEVTTDHQGLATGISPSENKTRESTETLHFSGLQTTEIPRQHSYWLRDFSSTFPTSDKCMTTLAMQHFLKLYPYRGFYETENLVQLDFLITRETYACTFCIITKMVQQDVVARKIIHWQMMWGMQVSLEGWRKPEQGARL